jgi:SAM-dependent methyltransferase
VTENKKHILEIGAGAGISLLFLPERNIIRTDFLPSDSLRIIGDIDAQNLPFADNSFDFAFGMDVIHHLADPFLGLSEIKRVVNESEPGTLMMFIEPYISLMSYLPYKVFHQEKTTLFSNTNLQPPMVSNQPEDGDQTIPRLIFCSKKGKSKLRQIFPPNQYIIDLKFISVFSFFLTGGINRPLPTPAAIITALVKLENLIPQSMMKLFGSRIIIKIIKI